MKSYSESQIVIFHPELTLIHSQKLSPVKTKTNSIDTRPGFKIELERFVSHFLPYFHPVYFPEFLLCIINTRSQVYIGSAGLISCLYSTLCLFLTSSIFHRQNLRPVFQLRARNDAL